MSDTEEVEVQEVEPPEDQTPSVLYTYGLSGEPIRWAPADWQAIISTLRQINAGLLPASAVQPLLDAAFPDAGYSADDLTVAGPPKGTFSFAEGDEGEVTFTSDDAGLDLPDEHHRWGFGDQTKGSGGETTHTFAAPGVYTVFLETALAGGVYSSAQEVTVGPEPTPQAELAEAAAVEAEAAEEEEEEDFVPDDHTVDEVLAYAEAHPEDIPDLIEVESEGKARVTLLEKLNAMVE